MLTIAPVDFTKLTHGHSGGMSASGLIWKETQPKQAWHLELRIPHAYYVGERVHTSVSIRVSSIQKLFKYLTEDSGLNQRMSKDQFNLDQTTLYIDSTIFENLIAGMHRFGLVAGKDYITKDNSFNMYCVESQSFSLRRFLNHHRLPRT
jgi:hypothetical protein